jgi:tetratricopeptide (TPR) repeat protein
MKIFISYASEKRNEAEKLALALRNSGHKVFFDREALSPGETYDDKIRRSIQRSDLFIFLVSPTSVKDGRYALTELKFAREKWTRSSGNVLPVVIEPTDIDHIPNYLKSVSLLEPSGHFVPEVQAQVERIRLTRHKRRILWNYMPLTILAVAIPALAYSDVIPGGKAFIRKYIYQDAARNVLETRILENLKDDNFCATAREAALRLTTQYPDYAKAFRHLGTAHYCLREFDQAKKAFQKAADLAPDNINYKYGLAANTALSGDPLGANKIYKVIVAHHEKIGVPYGPAIYSIALNDAAAGRFQQASTEFRKLLWDPVYGERANFGYRLCRITFVEQDELKPLARDIATLVAGNRDLQLVVSGRVPAGRKGAEFIPFLWAIERLGERRETLLQALSKAKKTQ